MQAADKADVDCAVAAAKKALFTWRDVPGSTRRDLLLKLANLMAEHQQELAEWESRDNGKPVSVARDVDVALAIEHFRYFAGWADKGMQVIWCAILHGWGRECLGHWDARVPPPPKHAVGAHPHSPIPPIKADSPLGIGLLPQVTAPVIVPPISMPPPPSRGLVPPPPPPSERRIVPNLVSLAGVSQRIMGKAGGGGGG